MAAKAVLFDYGNVLVRWDPRFLYRKLIADEAAREHFLAHVCPLDWHNAHDGGALMADTLPARAKLFPEHTGLIMAWGARYGEMVEGEIAGSIAILDELTEAGVPLAMLTNMPSDQIEACFALFTRRHLFDPIVVSGVELMLKPEARMFELTLARMGRAAGEVLFVDDSAKNCAGAAAVGLKVHHFNGPENLRAALAAEGLLR